MKLEVNVFAEVLGKLKSKTPTKWELFESEFANVLRHDDLGQVEKNPEKPNWNLQGKLRDRAGENIYSDFEVDSEGSSVVNSESEQLDQENMDVIIGPVSQKQITDFKVQIFTKFSTGNTERPVQNIPQITNVAPVSSDVQVVQIATTDTINPVPIPSGHKLHGTLRVEYPDLQRHFNSPRNPNSKENNSPLDNIRGQIIAAPKQGQTDQVFTNKEPIKTNTVQINNSAPGIGETFRILANDIASFMKVEPVNGRGSVIDNHQQIRSPNKIFIQLHPRSMGIVELKMNNIDGILTVAIETSSRATEKLLKAEIVQIVEKLQASGIQHEEVSVNYNQNLEKIIQKNQQYRSENLLHNLTEQNSKNEPNSQGNTNEFENSKTNWETNITGLTGEKNAEQNDSRRVRSGLYL